MVAASLLLLTYGGLLLFFGCSSLAITSTSAIRQERLGGFGQESRAQIALDFFSGAAQFLISALMIGSGVAAFRRLPIARWAGLSALAGQLLTMVISTALVFFFVNVQEQLGLIPGEGIMAIALVVKFFPYAIWLAFTVPIGILLNAPSARLAFADRPLFGIRFGGQDAPPDQ
jgi:hypothetical protein